MNSNLKGNIGESEALAYFIREGYEVYLPFGTATTCDLVVVKGGITKKVSVKTTSSTHKNGKYIVKIRQGKLNKQLPFDNTSSDILFIYIQPENRYYILESSTIKTKYELTVK